MAFSRAMFLLVVITASCTASQVPVYIWGDLGTATAKSNPLAKVTASEFSGILKNELQDDQFCVIFIEETLSVEDFSRKDADGKTSYPYLHANIGDSLYLPSVENALRVLNKLADPEKVDHVKLTENGLSAEIEPESGKFLFINLKDAREGESRSDLLRRHNDFMENMFSKLQERYDKVMAIYTAHYPSWTIPVSHSRVRRQANDETSNDFSLDGLLIYYRSLVLQEGRNTVNLSGVQSNSTSFNETVQNTTLNFGDNSVTLNFVSKGGYWFFDTVTLTQTSGVTEDLQPTSEVYALLGFSYRCGQQVSFGNVNETKIYKLTFEDLKIQPFFTTGNASELVYGDSFNCVGFFSVPIWSGLFVVFVLLAITFYGIMMMMDIRTMDRFDDPKGKTITINAAE